ncbi:uroporphyrinogen-III C-methyltransferase [Marisediminicola senii]|uniref:uroporphyrinogen-III C-methyltransferase n=1 Tax=Marisediminicola senii TaxID=2711233 RepID=UPI0013EE0970|nr:uroporphyrinogen-III C-methyltransferase [Marisediminicola senii]
MTPGQVYLVGGGPGSEDLLTLGAVKALAAADVVLYDRLAPHDRLAQFAPTALLIDVGKTPGHHPIPQCDIEGLIVKHALEGSCVVRLKGGDPFVFGRGGEEVMACRAAGVEVTVIPGVSSAVAVPAAAGIAVTHRDVSRMFTVVSGHAPFSETELAGLAGLASTIVVLMGVGNLPQITQGLVRHGLPASTPIAVIERGYTREQRSIFSSLDRIVYDATAACVKSPAVLVIGEVVAYANRDDANAAFVLETAAALAPSE